MRSKNKAKTEDGEEGGEEDVEGEHLVTVDHEDDAGYVFLFCTVANFKSDYMTDRNRLLT